MLSHAYAANCAAEAWHLSQSHAKPLNQQTERPIMSTPLITHDYTKTVLRISTTDYDALLTALIAGVSQAIKTYCRRDLVSTEYVELYDGTGSMLVKRAAFQSSA